MIRTLALAAAAAAVGFKLGQRAAESPESRFSKPEVTGDEVAPTVDPEDIAVENGEATLRDDARRNISSKIGHSNVADRIAWSDNDEDGVIDR